MFVLGNANDTVFQYSTALNTASLDLSTGSVFDYTPTSDVQVTLSNPADSGTVSGATLLLEGGASSAYDIANAVYDSVSFSVSGQDTDPYGLFFKPDGTIMYVAGDAGNDINQYSLATAWDISTASYVQNFSVGGQETAPSGVFFRTDGTKMFIVGTATDTVYQYSLSTAWDISTSSYDSVSFSVGSQDTLPFDISFKPDGSKMFILGNTGDSVYEYALSTSWNVSTATYSQSFSVASQEAGPQGLFLSSDGVYLFVVGTSATSVNQYTLGTSWDVSTAAHTQAFSVSSQEGDPQALFFKADGTKMYVLGSSSDSIYQYNTATPATITYDPTLEWPSGTAPTSPAIGETDVVTFNTRDGGSTYQGVLAIDGAK